ncbi:hypothetical protein FA13DRAFT_196916 [Coprinellus micaceus]|uniref:Uncharacterized protein n=1 Tax=Coprinellus micaceus TaxID=71717 RepID=A0A4Y7TIE4_COPMI|nr:hypothetical protein FA13DRAFT_196916 [Coprinellus micaceus]
MQRLWTLCALPMEMLPTTTHGPTIHPNLYFYPAPKRTPHWPIRRRHWHPKITVYRLLVTALTIGLGTAKAITSTPTGGSSCSVTLEWISGIIILILTFFLSRYETHDDPKPHWLFKYDLLDGIRALWHRPSSYGGEDRYSEPPPAIRGPLVTGYRLLVSMSALVFGVVKATLSYLGYKTAPTVVEWVFGVVMTVSLYWLGMYENSPTADLPWLFVRDCSNQVFVYFLCAVHLAALFAMHYWTVSRFNHAKQGVSQTLGNPGHNVSVVAGQVHP